MGGPMAQNICIKLPELHQLLIYDANKQVSRQLANKLDAHNVKIATDIIQIGSECDVIISCLPTPAITKAVYEIVEQAPSRGDWSKRLIIDCSTIDPTTSRSICKSLKTSNKGSFIDAPMSGGTVGASTGTLTFMVGGSEELVQQATSILELMGRRIFHCGAQGTGLVAKLANNYLLAISNIATAEAMNLGIQSGLDPVVLAKVINAGTGRCWASEINNPVPEVVASAPASRNYRGGFGVNLMNKDLRLAMVAAREAGAPILLGNSASEIYSSLEKNDATRNCDFSVVYRLLKAGLDGKLAITAKI